MSSTIFKPGLLDGQVAIGGGGGSGLCRASALGARDNWFGPWPPGGLTDEGGKSLAEERRSKP